MPDLDATLVKELRNATEHDVKFFQRRATKTIDQNSNFIAFGIGLLGKNAFHQLVDKRICTCKLLATDARLAMDAHADFHFVFANREGGVTNFRYNAAGKCNAHRARAQARLVCKTRHFIK